VRRYITESCRKERTIVDTEPENLRVFEALQQADLDKVESPLGKKHRASEWLEDGGETEYYLDTDVTSIPTGPSTTTSTACRFT
jgi:hypothetical protein